MVWGSCLQPSLLGEGWPDTREWRKPSLWTGTKQTTWILFKAILLQEPGMKDATKINGGLLNKTELCHATRNFFSQNQRGEFLPTWLNKQPWSAILRFDSLETANLSASCQLGFSPPYMFIYIICFAVCFHSPWKAPKRDWLILILFIYLFIGQLINWFIYWIVTMDHEISLRLATTHVLTHYWAQTNQLQSVNEYLEVNKRIL